MVSDETDCAFVPAPLRASWPRQVSVGFGQSVHPYNGEAMNPEIMRGTLANALKRADDYVWFYTEEDAWMAPGGFPQTWDRAIRDAVASVEGRSSVSERISPLPRRKRGGRRRHKQARGKN